MNTAYEFSGDRLLRAVPYGAWYLEKLSAPTIALYRQMRPEELAVWKSGRFASLGRDWGYGAPVLHFSTDRQFTTAAGPEDQPRVEIRVSRLVLYQLAMRVQIWSAALDEKTLVSEFVLPTPLFTDLVAKGQLVIVLP